MLSCSARAAGSVWSDGSFSGDGVLDDGTGGAASSSSSVSLPGAGTVSEERLDGTRLVCAESENECGRGLGGLEAGGSVGEELGTTSSRSASKLGRPKENSWFAGSGSGCVVCNGGVCAGGTFLGKVVISAWAKSGIFAASQQVQYPEGHEKRKTYGLLCASCQQPADASSTRETSQRGALHQSLRYVRAIACQPPAYPMPVLSYTLHPLHPDTTDGSLSD
jgi:hypothetical protein